MAKERRIIGSKIVWMGTSAERNAESAATFKGEFWLETDTGNEYFSTGLAWLLSGIDGAALVASVSVNTTAGGESKKFSLSSTSAQSQAITSTSALVTPSVDCYFREGVNPTALAPVLDGALGDNLLFGGNQYRISGITSGNKLAFITTGATGTVEVVPGG